MAVVVGIAMMLLVSRIRYQFWAASLCNPIMAVQLVLIALTLFSAVGHPALGATRWIKTPWLAFQPSELAKISVTLYLARLLTVPHNFTPGQWVVRLAPIGMLLPGMILSQPDMGTTILVSSVMLGMLFIAGMRPAYLYSLLGGAIGVFAFTMMQSEYRRRRVFAFLNPWEDPQGAGFQTHPIFYFVSLGQAFGRGIG